MYACKSIGQNGWIGVSLYLYLVFPLSGVNSGSSNKSLPLRLRAVIAVRPLQCARAAAGCSNPISHLLA